MRPQVACLLLLLTTAFAAKDSSEDFDIENLRDSEWASLDEDQEPESSNDQQQAIRDALESYIKEKQKKSPESNIPSNSFTLNSPPGSQSFSSQQNTPFVFDTSNLQQPQLSQGNFNFGQPNNRPSLELLVNNPPLSHSKVAQLLNSPQLNQNNPTFAPLSNRQQQGQNIPFNSEPQFSLGTVSTNLNQQQFNPNKQSFVPLNTAQEFTNQNVAPFASQQNFKQGSRVQFLNSPQSAPNQFLSQQSQYAPHTPPVNTASLLSGNYGTLPNENTAKMQEVAHHHTHLHNIPPKKDEHVIDVKDFLNYLQNNDDEDASPAHKGPHDNSEPPKSPPPPSDPEPKPSPPPYPQDLHDPESFLLKDTADYMIARDNRGKPILLSDVEENGNIPSHVDISQYAPAASNQVTVNALTNGKFENITKERQDSQYFDLLNVQSNGKFEKINEIRPSSTFVPDFASKQVYATGVPTNGFYHSHKHLQNTQQTFSPSSQETIQQFYDTRPSTSSFKTEDREFLKSQNVKHTNSEISKTSTNFPTTGHFLVNGPSTIFGSQSGQQGPFFLDQSKLIQVNTPETYDKNFENINTFTTPKKPVTANDSFQGILDNKPQNFYIDFAVTQIQDQKKTSIEPPQLPSTENKQLNPTATPSFQLKNAENSFNYVLKESDINNDNLGQKIAHEIPYNNEDFKTYEQNFKAYSEYLKDKESFLTNHPFTNPSEFPNKKREKSKVQDFDSITYFKTENNPKESEENYDFQWKSTKALNTLNSKLNNNNTKQEQTFYEKLRQAMFKTETTTISAASFGTTIPFDYTSINVAPSTLPTRATIPDTTITNKPPTQYFTTLSHFPVTDFLTTNNPSTVQLTTNTYNDKLTTLPPRPYTDKFTQTTDIYTTTLPSSPETFTTPTRPSTDRFTTGSDFPNTHPFITVTNTLPPTSHIITTANPPITETQKITTTPHIYTTTSHTFTGDGEQGLPTYNIPSLPLQISGQQNVNSYYSSSNTKPLQDSFIKPSNKKAPAYTNTWLKNNYLSDPIYSEKNNLTKLDELKEAELLKLSHYHNINSHDNNKFHNPNINYNPNIDPASNTQTTYLSNNYNTHGEHLPYRPLFHTNNKDNTRGPYRPSKLDDNIENLVLNNKVLKPETLISGYKNEGNSNFHGYINVPNLNLSDYNNKNLNPLKNSDFNKFLKQSKPLSHSTEILQSLGSQKEHNIYYTSDKTHIPQYHALPKQETKPNILHLNSNNNYQHDEPQLDTHNTNNNKPNLNNNYFNLPNIPLTESSNLNNSQYTQHKIPLPLHNSGHFTDKVISNEYKPSLNYKYNSQNNPVHENINDFSSNSNYFANHKNYAIPNNQDNTHYLNNIQYSPVSDYGNFNAQTSVSIQEQRPPYESSSHGNFVLLSSQNNYQQAQSLSQPVFISSTNGFYPNAPNHVLLTPHNPAHNHNVPLHTQNNSPIALGQVPVALNDTPGINLPQGYPAQQVVLQQQNTSPGQNQYPQNGYNANIIPAQYQPLVESDTPIIPGFNAVEAFEKEDLIPVYLPADNCSAVFQVLEDRQSVLGVRALPGQAECRITFTSPNTSRLAMQVLGLDLPQGDNACSAASISVFSQKNGRNMLLNQLCGEIKESPVMLTEGQSALVTVQSEAGTTRPGFTIVAFLW